MTSCTKIFFEIQSQNINSTSFNHQQQAVDESFYRRFDNNPLQMNKFHRLWKEVSQHPEIISEEKKNIIQQNLSIVITKMKNKIDQIVLDKKYRMKNRMINLQEEMGTIDSIQLKATRWESFTKKYSKKISKWQMRIEEIKANQKGRTEIKNYYHLKTRSRNFALTQKFHKTFETQFKKIQKEFHNDVELIEKVHDFFMNAKDFSFTQRKFYTSFKNLNNINLSFKKFRLLMHTLDIRFKTIKKDIGNDINTKRQRVNFLDELLQIHIECPNSLLYFDVTSFNWEKRSPKQWSHALKPTGIIHRNAFNPMHMLTIMNLQGIIAFQLIRESVTSENIFHFLHTVFIQRRANLPLTQFKLILDNSTLHKTLIMKNLSIKFNVCFYFIVPRNPFFNLIEYVFRYIKSKNKTWLLYKMSGNKVYAH